MLADNPPTQPQLVPISSNTVLITPLNEMKEPCKNQSANTKSNHSPRSQSSLSNFASAFCCRIPIVVHHDRQLICSAGEAVSFCRVLLVIRLRHTRTSCNRYYRSSTSCMNRIHPGILLRSTNAYGNLSHVCHRLHSNVSYPNFPVVTSRQPSFVPIHVVITIVPSHTTGVALDSHLTVKQAIKPSVEFAFKVASDRILLLGPIKARCLGTPRVCQFLCKFTEVIIATL